jgi:hypothetical protein
VNNFDDVRDQTLTLTGAAYGLAEASSINDVDFGTVHVGDVLSQYLSVANTAPSPSGYYDKLNAAAAGMPGDATASGSFSLLAPGATSSVDLVVNMSSATAGAKHGTVTIGLTSDGTGTSGLGLTALADQIIDVDAVVNNYANAAILMKSGDGTFSGGGTHYSLDFGTINSGSGSVLAGLSVLNDVLGPADLLKGGFDITAGSYVLSGFDSFSDVAAGAEFDGLSISLSKDLPNDTYAGSFLLHPRGANAGGYDEALPDITVEFTGTIIPEPATLALVLAGLGVLIGRRRRA